MTALVVLIATAVAVIAAAVGVSRHWRLRRLRAPGVRPLSDDARRCYSADQERLVGGPEAAVMRARMRTGERSTRRETPRRAMTGAARAAAAVEGAAPAAAGIRSAS